ncbi:GNAT family N-acetyltransferase [Oceanibium sediminis]|uniref:GNAT family N-acetyltransferase n=1 Tax=Oceanibium sediminis TaxID=2026339 RepID=UPI000DD38B30|nr:GNAT family N-acetyltransferase [Oceanibium sediminis]
MPDLTLHVRPGRREDVPGVDALLARSYPQLLKADYPPSILVTAVPQIARAQPALVSCGTYYVAVTESGRVLSAGGWTRRAPAGGRASAVQGSIRHFATDPDYLRRGLATTLMERCLRDAREAGLEWMECLSTRTAVPFYARQGFDAVAEVSVELAAGITFPAIRMTRAL